jgi:hypothetical protein
MDPDRPLIKASLWGKLSQGDKGRLNKLSVQYAGNKSRPANVKGRRSLGVSLEMLAQSGLIGADLDDPNCTKFVSDLVECQADVVAFVQTIPELRAKVIAMGELFDAAAKAGHLNSFGEANTNRMLEMFNTLVSGLDVHAVCLFLAREHAPPSPDMA